MPKRAELPQRCGAGRPHSRYYELSGARAAHQVPSVRKQTFGSVICQCVANATITWTFRSSLRRQIWPNSCTWVTQVNPSSGAPQPLSLLAQTGSTFGRLVDAVPLRICARDASGGCRMPWNEHSVFASQRRSPGPHRVASRGMAPRADQNRRALQRVLSAIAAKGHAGIASEPGCAIIASSRRSPTRPGRWTTSLISWRAAFLSKTAGSIAGRPWGRSLFRYLRQSSIFPGTRMSRQRENGAHRRHRAEQQPKTIKCLLSGKQTDMRAEKST